MTNVAARYATQIIAEEEKNVSPLFTSLYMK